MNTVNSSCSEFSGTAARGSRKFALPLFVVLGALLAALVVLPSSAGAFGISNLKTTASTTQAGAHPNFTMSFNRTGSESEDLNTLEFDLPIGMFPNPESPNGGVKCSVSQFNSDKCPASTQAASVTSGVKAMSLLNLTIPGNAYLITPDSTDAATVGIVLRPAKLCILFIFCAQPQKIFLKTHFTIKTFADSRIHAVSSTVPKAATIGIPLIFVTPTIQGDITVNSMSMTFQSRAGTSGSNQGDYLTLASSSCLPSTTDVRITSYQNVTAAASASYTPTGCNNVPFNPTTDFQVLNPSSEQASATHFQLNVPQASASIQNAPPKYVDIDFPNGSGVDTSELAGVQGCSQDQLKADNCPADSIIGSASSVAPYLPPTLTGTVYALSPVTTQVPMGIVLNGSRGTKVIFYGVLGTRGDANEGTGHAYALFNVIPQLPYANVVVDVNTALYKNPQNCGPATTTATLTGYNGGASTGGDGTVKTTSQTYNVTNCATAPETTITNGPGDPTVNPSPAISFSSSIPGSTFMCRYDSDPYIACSSPYVPSTPLTNAQHTFSVYAVNGVVDDPTPATYTFTVSTGSFMITPHITPSSYQAAAHPDLATSFDVTGGQPKSLQIDMPNGFNASLAAVPLCATADALAGNCSSASEIGTGSITVNAFGGPVTGVGSIYLTDGPTGNDAGGIAVKFPLAGLGTFIANGGAYLTNNGNNQTIALRDIPATVGGNDITVSNLTINFAGNANGDRFLTNASNCALATSKFTASGVAWDGSQSNVTPVAYQATGCGTAGANVPFAPVINQVLSDPVAGQKTGVNATVDVPIDNSTIRALRVTEPPVLGPAYPSFGAAADQCPSAAAQLPTSVFDPTNCPAQSKVGTMTITTPLLPHTITGDVFLINKSPLPWFGVKFDDPGISFRLTGVTSTPQVDSSCDPNTDPLGFCQTQVSLIFNNLPDVPITHVDFDLNGPDRTGVNNVTLSGKILQVASTGDSVCLASSPAKSTSVGFTGKIVNASQDILISGC